MDNRAGRPVLTIFVFALECTLIIGLSSAFRKAMDKVRNNEKRFRAMIEKGTDGIVLVNDTGQRIYASASVQHITGYTVEEYLAIAPWQLGHPDETNEIRQKMEQLYLRPGESLELVHRYKHKQGHWIWVESVVTNLLHESGVNALIANFRDITERVMTDQRQKDFIGIASHELKTPLTSLRLYSQVLQTRLQTHEDTELLKMAG